MQSKRIRPWLVAGLLVVFSAACGPQGDGSQQEAQEGGSTMAAQGDDGWQVLFDGTGLDHWRGYRQAGMPEAWTVTEDGALYYSGEGEGGDIVTKDQYADFELEMEWKIAEGGNSGIMYRVSEDHDYPWRTGPEMQILDDAAHPDAANGPSRMAGANYDMHAPAQNAVKPAGQWNQVRLVVDGAHVEHWLNGQKIVEYELWSDDWKQRIAGSKWADMPSYGMEKTGHIALQDHGDPVWFRNVRIRRL